MLVLEGERAVNDAEIKKSAIQEKPVRNKTPITASNFSSYRRSNILLVTAVALSVFLCEAFVMIALQPLYHLSPWLVAFFDAFILILILSPVIYVFIFRPVIRHINERERAEQALRESELRFRTVFRTSPDSITISRLEDGRIVNINDGFTELSCYTREDVLGRSALDIPLWNEPEKRAEMVAGLQKDGQVNNFEARFKHKDGRLVEVLISARLITLSDEPHILAVSRDISELKKNENTLLASQNFLRISNRHREMDPLLKEFIALIKSLTNCSAIGMRVLDGNGNIPYQAYEGFSPEFYESENPHTIDSIRCMCSDVILGKIKIKPRLVTKAGSFCVGSTSHLMTTLSEAEKNQVCDVCSTYGYESVALIPIRLADRILGLIHLADAHKDMFSPDTIAILEGAAMQLGTSIERVHAEEALQKSHRELEKRVQERTSRLVSANELLSLEIEERKLNEKKLMEQQDKLRSLSSELMLTEERERRRIATELHDRIGQTLAVSKIKLGELREALPAGTVTEILTDIREFIEQTIQDTRSLTFELSPPVLYELGLEAALAWLINQTREKHGLLTEFKDDGQAKPLDNGCRVIAFQAVRELLFNIVKHARAQSATISIRRDDDAVRIDIEDDGIGFDTSELDATVSGSMGFGLFSVRERLQPLGGRIEIHSETGSGTRVAIVLPLARNIGVTGE
jgi:PAS domain S-box-containing protein